MESVCKPLERDTTNPHAPVFIENSAKKGIVVFIHGFMGSPVQFSGLIDIAYKHGYSATAMLLPGHGGKMKDFSKSTFKCWQDHVNAEIEKLAQTYTSMLLVGHSMGGLLSINAAVKFPEYIRGIFIIASPFKATIFSAAAIKIGLRKVFGRKSDPVTAAYNKSNSVKLSPNLIWGLIKPYIEFRKLSRTARGNLPEIKVPVTAVYSYADEIAPVESAKTLEAELHGVPFNEILLHDSLHAYYTDKEQTIIGQTLIEALDFL